MTKRTLDITSLAVAVAGGVLAIGDKWTGISVLPDWLVHSWPVVLAVATVIDRVGNILLKWQPPAVTPFAPTAPKNIIP